VVLVLPAPVDREVDGLRRACGDASLDRVPPHVTLVPPVNVNDERLGDVDDLLRAAAASTRGALRVEVGPPTTFLPHTPVLHLPVVEGAEEIGVLRDAVFVDPLARPLDWPFVPHVTLAQDLPVARIEAAVHALAGYRAAFAVDRLHLLEEGPDRVWRVLADHRFAPPAVIGRGGLPLEVVVTGEPDVRGMVLLAGRPFTVTARREGDVVGVARGWTAGATAHLAELVVAEAARGQGVGSHVLAAVEALARERGCAAVVAAAEPGSDEAVRFLRGRGFGGEEGFVRRL
jgi:ribosomal protein S18 acetylase RimI-like enzyme